MLRRNQNHYLQTQVSGNWSRAETQGWKYPQRLCSWLPPYRNMGHTSQVCPGHRVLRHFLKVWSPAQPRSLSITWEVVRSACSQALAQKPGAWIPAICISAGFTHAPVQAKVGIMPYHDLAGACSTCYSVQPPYSLRKLNRDLNSLLHENFL